MEDLNKEFESILQSDHELIKVLTKNFDKLDKNSMLHLTMMTEHLQFSNKVSLKILDQLVDINENIKALNSNFCSSQGWD